MAAFTGHALEPEGDPMRRIALALVTAAGLAFAGVASAQAATQTEIWINCPFTGLSATIDPIVDPGGSSAHFHDFFGSTGLTASSTPDSLRAGGPGTTTCATSTDTAAYWAPTLVLGPGQTQTYGAARYPCATDPAGLPACHYSHVRAYYGLQSAAPARLTIPPTEETVVGGSSEAGGPQPTGQIAWSCGGSTAFEQYPYDCSGSIKLSNDQDGVILRVILPRCWDGTGAAQADFAYPLNNSLGPKCPAGFPKVLPLINIRFHTGIVNPCLGELDPVTGLQVSCPAGSMVAPNFGFENADGTIKPWYQAHGDFMNGWQYAPQDNPGGLDDLITDCLKLALPCPVNPHTSPASNMAT
jgi:hypothetical protein